MSLLRLRCALVVLSFCLPLTLQGQVNVITHHYDNARTGANTSETTLTTSNVNQTSFGKLFSVAVDGSIYAQPLYVHGLTVSGATHNVVFVATAANSVYAFDADNGAQLWHTNYGTPPQEADVEIDPDIVGAIGIIGTPVIDTSTNTIYLVERNKNTDGTFHQFLRALDLATGTDKFSSPKEITATFAGFTFNAKIQNQRPALALLNGIVYIGWASHNDVGDYHGWLLGYQASNITTQQYVYSTTNASNNLGGIWQSGNGFVIDSSNNFYMMTGNGQFDGSANFGMSFLKLSSSLGVQDYFAPSNWSTLSSNDRDLGSSGPLLIPGTNYLFGGGKDGRLFLVDITNMGKNNSSSDNVHQEFQATNGEIHAGPVYWSTPSGVQTVYIWSENDTGKAYTFNGSTLNTTPSSKTSVSTVAGSSGSLSISSNGSNSGTGILWANAANGNANAGTVAGTLHAYDATNLGTELWNSKQNSARDDYGNFAKFTPPVVANGKVYMATFSNQLVVYGEIGSTIPAAPTNPGATAGNAQVSLSWTASGGATSYNVYRSTTSGGEGTTAIATGITTTSYTNTGLTNGTTYFYKIAAVNTAGTSPQSSEVSAMPSATISTQISISCGGPAAGSFVADVDFTGGTVATAVTGAVDTSLITAPVPPQSVFQHERYGAMTYTIGGLTAGASENVTLYFAELYWTAAGQRIFNVSINGTQVLTNFDIFATAGAAYKGVQKTFSTTANSSGQVVITFTAGSIDLPKIDGITIAGSSASPNFTLSSSPASLTVNQGASGTSTITVNSTGGFNSSVSLSASGLPSGVTAAFSPASTTGTSTLTLTASSAATTGTATVTVTGTSGSLSQTTTVSLTVNTVSPGGGPISISCGGPASGSFVADVDFSGGTVATAVTGAVDTSLITAPVPSQSVFQHERYGAMTYTMGGFTAGASESVTLYFAELYWTATGQRIFNVSINGTQVLTNFDIFATAGAAYKGVQKSFTTTANSSGQVVVTFTTGSIDLPKIDGITVANVTGTANYTLSSSPSSLTVNQSASGTSTITVNPSSGFNSSVSLSASGMPSGVTASFSPTSTTGTSTLTLSASSSATTGTSTITITGTSGSLSHTTTVSLTVNPVTSATPTYTLSASPTSLSVTQGASGTSTITVNPADGFNSSVSLSTSGLPGGVTASFSPASATSTSTLTLTASSSATTGAATVTITGTSGSLTKTTTVALTVNASSGSTCDPAWAPNVSYAVGQLVSYAGNNYKCIQAHTSLTGWEPPNVPALWQLLAACQ